MPEYSEMLDKHSSFRLDAEMFECTRAMNRLHLFADGNEFHKCKKDEIMEHWVYEESFLVDRPLNSLFMHVVTQGILCCLAMFVNMCMLDTYQWFDIMDGRDIIAHKELYGLSHDRMLWAWLFAAFGFIFAGINESLLPYWSPPLVYFWFQKIFLPLFALFWHEWWIPDDIWGGRGVVGSHKLWGVLLMVLVLYSHYYFWTEE
jgi:hypothetical protein